MSKKPISILIFILLILFLVQEALAILAPPPPTVEPPQPPPSGEEREECGLATCTWLDFGCYLTYFLTLPLRIIALLIGAIGLGIGLIIVWIGFGTIPGIINAIINTSLSLKYGEILKNWEIVSQLKAISLELIYLFLLIVGLGTILKFLFPFAEYEAKKTLVPLIAFALLIHFAPTISQKIIEWGNTATYALKTTLAPESGEDFLHSKTIGQKLSQVLVNSASLLGDIFCIDGHWERHFEEHEGKGPVIPMIMLYAAYPWIVASVGVFILSSFISFGVLFMMRTILFIVLVIVSPIAFLTAALRTREIRAIFPGFLNWEEWSETLLKWAFVGVMLVIWLAVAGKIAEMGGNLFLGGSVGIEDNELNVGKPTTLNDLKSQLDPRMVRLVKYLIPPLGAAMAIFFASLSTPKLGEQFSKAAFGFLRGVTTAMITGAAIGIGAAVGVAAGVVGGAVGAATGIGGKARAFFTSLPKAAAAFGKEAFLRTTAETVKGAALAPIPKEMREEAIKGWRRRATREGAEEEMEEIYKREGAKGLEKIIKSKITLRTDIEKAAALAKLLKEKKLRDELIESKEFQKFLETKEGSKYVKDVLKLRADLAPRFINPKTGQPWKPGEIIKEMTDAELLQIRVKALLEPEVIEAMDNRQREVIIRRGTKERREALTEGYVEMVRREAGVILDTTTRERLRASVIAASSQIQRAINNLRSIAQTQGRPELEARAEALVQLGNAIYQRRL